MNKQDNLPKLFAGIIFFSFLVLGSVATFHFHGFVTDPPRSEQSGNII
ncbi:MAG: hypothetical protein QNJ38_08750 [Prochloraceae cyanobacterium]|nr:hypothetical protein [Prochloraceae cyanobacterium]